QVYGDGVKLYDSGVTRGADAVKAVSVNVTGRSDLKLVVTNGGDSIDYDHADWASAKVVCGSATTPPGASARVLLAVPSALRSTPFDVDRFLNVPSGATAEVYARVSKARFLAAAAGDDLLVSQPSSGKVLLVRPGADGVGVVTDFATGLKKPHDMVFHTIGATTYLYVSESNRVTRSVYVAGDSARRPFEVVVRDLPDGNSSGALGGAYGHELKNIALDGDKLYVSIASASNADPADLAQNPKQGAIYLYSATALDQAATSGRLFAQGLRNAEGLALVPGTADLWAVVNNRDNIGYPYQRDFDGDGTNDYGKVMQAYVDNHPPELFTRVRDGGNYGWPFCNSNPDGGLVDMPFDRDVQNNADGSKLDCAAADRVNRGIQAHSAPLSLTFLQSTNAPAVYRQGAVSALHGSWNRSVPTGYKIAFFPWNSATGTPSDQIDLVTGWLVNGSSWGRPVDAIVDRSGRLLVSDDAAGAIYRVTLPR
ncbi:NPCBM/NEW2 domain-containing protein, partial [Deinococcus yavapaiensis]